MVRFVLSLMLAATLLSPQCRAVAGMKTGVLLRMHVIAQDDTAEMQRVKLCVRDAVQQAYGTGSTQPMLARAQALLPQLTRAARDAAAREGFSGPVQVCIERRHFDRRTLDGVTFPAGEYPALMVRLGDARGKNWWGLVDPALALDCASLPGGAWDWTLSGLWQALLHWLPGVTAHE